ncbi:transglycosylase SLT domain-containing protein [Litchfieldella xinjiangensis]|uniref:transglycosylase SLT domain-containing protein n=1 Tax=Litchfieldella xinjiangensis TaxID=1166948 RepID=UPI0005BD02D8|nr:transglycosylase SLT domain-containing protein [Halomonas xinjiangensis]
MRRRPFARRLGVLLISLTSTLPIVTFAQDNDDAMRDALNAARSHQWNQIDYAAIEGHPLAGYVEYHRVKSRLPVADPNEILDFIHRYDDSPLAEWMRGAAISSYGQAGRHVSLLEVSDGEPTGTERRCYYYTALLDRQPDVATEGGRDLWHVGASQPSACDTLFDTLRARGDIDDTDIWERMMLAWENGETGLMNYLERQLNSEWQTATQAVAELQRNFSAVTRVPARVGPGGQGSGPMFAAAMHGFTRADTEAALEAWRKIAPHVDIEASYRHAIERDLAFYSMVREVSNNQGWVDDALARLAEPDLLELRVRRALAERDWRGVIDWVHAMPDEPRQQARWQYWLGRALEQLGDPKTAEKAFTAAAGERSFFGFAAADRLGQPYNLNLDRATFNDAYRQEVDQWPVVQRTEALMRIGEQGLANSEWYTAAARASADQAHALADYARRQGWYPKLVQTTIAAKMWDALDWRFPEAYRDDFLKWGAANDVDPYLLMGIARRESAYNPQALSPAGARGLMQLMPGTATLVSRQLGIADPGPHGVLEPEVNIRLGSAYISDMIDRYRGNRIAATAAYNAGPGRVDRWLREANGEFDLFVESIPFRETRDYVQAVLSYRVIFESLANGGDTQGVTMLSATERHSRYDASLLARN